MENDIILIFDDIHTDLLVLEWIRKQPGEAKEMNIENPSSIELVSRHVNNSSST